jgi:hypothetical protein
MIVLRILASFSASGGGANGTSVTRALTSAASSV